MGRDGSTLLRLSRLTGKLPVLVTRDLVSALMEGSSALGISRARVVRTRAEQAVIGVLLENMRGPAGHSADGKDRRIQIDWDAESVVGRRRVEIHVGIQLLFALDQRFDALRH